MEDFKINAILPIQKNLDFLIFSLDLGFPPEIK